MPSTEYTSDKTAASSPNSFINPWTSAHVTQIGITAVERIPVRRLLAGPDAADSAFELSDAASSAATALWMCAERWLVVPPSGGLASGGVREAAASLGRRYQCSAGTSALCTMLFALCKRRRCGPCADGAMEDIRHGVLVWLGRWRWRHGRQVHLPTTWRVIDTWEWNILMQCHRGTPVADKHGRDQTENSRLCRCRSRII